jgi:myo-inositol-1(or 4)-monophosphatase
MPPVLPPPSREPAALGEYAVRLATQAARLVRDAVTGSDFADLQVGAKSTATDLVTGVDRAAERWLVEQISRDRPGDAVLGEEGGDRPGTSGVRWVIDPIDGTVNFVLGLPQYAVSVAAQVDGTVLAGAVCNPASGELFHAVRGAGAYLTKLDARGRAAVRLTGPRDVGLARAVVGTGFAYDAARRARQADIVARLLPRVADIRRLGAAALDLCAVASARLDGYFEAGLNPWDYAAGALIAAEAGCVLTGLRGAPPSERMTAVAGAGLAPELFDVLEELGADRIVAPG